MAMILDDKALSKLREFLKTRNFTDKYFQTAQLVHKFDGVADIKVFENRLVMLNPLEKSKRSQNFVRGYTL